MKTLAFLNRKGGVGKTSLACHLAGAWAAAGQRVLVLDMDPQASLTQTLVGPEAAWSFPTEETLGALFDDALFDPVRIIHSTPIERIFLAPAGRTLGDWNFPRPQEMGDRQDGVRQFLNDMGGSFDRVLIDCPPCLQLCSWASLLAADGVIVPLVPEDPGAQGLVHVQRTVDEAAERNPPLRIVGYVLTMVQRIGLHRAYETLLRSIEGDLVAKTVIPMASLFKEAVMARRPLAAFKPKSAPARMIDTLAREIDERGAIDSPRRPYYLGNSGAA